MFILSSELRVSSRLLEHRVCRQTCVWGTSGAVNHCLQQKMQGLNCHKHLIPCMGLHDARLLKVRLPVRMLLSGSCITSDAMKPKFPLTPGAEGLPSPAAGGAGELWGEQPNLPCPVQSSTGCSSHAGKCFFPLTLQQMRTQGCRVWLGEGAVNGQLLMGI